MPHYLFNDIEKVVKSKNGVIDINTCNTSLYVNNYIISISETTGLDKQTTSLLSEYSSRDVDNDRELELHEVSI